MKSVRLLLVLILLPLLSACGGTTVKSTKVTRLEQHQTEIPEAELLDLGVLGFDPGLEDADDDDSILPEIRNAEARFFANQLAGTIQSTGAWGAVRVIPATDTIVDVYVTGRILHSDGENLAIAIHAYDSSGVTWLRREYEERASRYAYDRRNKIRDDPFQGLFNRIANDLLHERQKLDGQRAATLRTVSELRFARLFAPDAFAGYLEENRKGMIEIRRLPADNDPLLTRIRRIRERDYLYIDTMQEYYHAFSRQMETPYQNWRAESYSEVIAARELKQKSTQRLVGGIAAVVGGIAAATSNNAGARTGGFVAATGGGMLIKSALEKKAEAQLHIDTLVELGQSLEAEIEPRVIELEDRTITLTGNAEAQYQQWRALLQQIYASERGDI